MAKYGYVRVSTRDQKTDRQMDALIGYGISEKNIYVDQLSGKDFERPEYKRLLRRLKKGDLVVIKSIDRLGRNYSEILEQWRLISKDKEAYIEVLDMPLLNTDRTHNGLTGVFISDLVLQILAYVAETERSMILQRQREGIEAAKRRGVRFGRSKTPISSDFDMACMEYLQGSLSSREAAEKAHMSHSTFYRRCKEKVQTEDVESYKKCFKG